MTMSIEHIEQCGKRVLNGGMLSEKEALELIRASDPAEYKILREISQAVFRKFCSADADICSLVNAKSGSCGEDCRFCAQSSYYNVDVTEYPLMKPEEIAARARQAERAGTQRFCIVTSGNALSADDFKNVIKAFTLIRRQTNLALDGSLGVLEDHQLRLLKQAGVTRLNHNLETSERFFPRICTTHSYKDRYNTVLKIKKHKIGVCSGGIIGLGESEEDRVSLAFALQRLDVDCVPLNILNPRKGTPFQNNRKLSPQEIIKTIAVFRLILRHIPLKIAGGREVNLGDHQVDALRAGANGIIIGGYLTTRGNPVQDDLRLLRKAGLKV